MEENNGYLFQKGQMTMPAAIPATKHLSGRRKDAGWLCYLLAVVLIIYFILVRGAV